MDERSPSDRIRQAMFTTQGVIDSLVGPVVFLILFRTAGINAAFIGAGAVALALVGVRAARGQETTTAWYGVVGVAIGVALAKATGSSDGYFLPKVISNAVYGLAFLVSVLIGRPLIGIAWAFFHRRPLAWGYRPGVRRVFMALSLMWAAGFFLRAGVYGVLIADDSDRTSALATATIVLGLPLTAVLLAATLLVARRQTV